MNGAIDELSRQAQRDYEEGNLKAAAAAYRRILGIDPRHKRALTQLLSIALSLGYHVPAQQYLSALLQQTPNNQKLLMTQGILYYRQGLWDKAMGVFQRLLKGCPDSSVLHNHIANVQRAVGNIDQAIVSYQTAVRLDAANIDASINLGVMFGLKGERTAAENIYRQALVREPQRLYLYRNISATHRYTDAGDEDIVAMRQALARPGLGQSDAMHLHFALGKVYDDLREYDAAFTHWRQANTILRGSYQYDVEVEAKDFSNIKKLFSKDFFARKRVWEGSREEPIFIVGLPRSGSTLVEQILSCHPDVAAAGEIFDLRRSILALGSFPASFACPGKQALQRVVEGYLQGLEAYNPDRQPRTSDKELFNFVYIGAIKCLFPKARIIACWRDPLDTCWSVYRRYFPALRSFAYDPYELGRFYHLYADLMRHWHEVLPGFVLDMHYEELVDDQEGQTRRLLQHCGLDWNDSCLDFHRSKRAPRTESADQVKKTLYKEGIGQWKNYEQYMDGFRRGLGHGHQ